MSKEEKIQYERGEREGARRMAMELSRILGGPYDRENGHANSIMAMESASEMCAQYAILDDPLQFIEDNKSNNLTWPDVVALIALLAFIAFVVWLMRGWLE